MCYVVWFALTEPKKKKSIYVITVSQITTMMHVTLNGDLSMNFIYSLCTFPSEITTFLD